MHMNGTNRKEMPFVSKIRFQLSRPLFSWVISRQLNVSVNAIYSLHDSIEEGIEDSTEESIGTREQDPMSILNSTVIRPCLYA